MFRRIALTAALALFAAGQSASAGRLTGYEEVKVGHNQYVGFRTTLDTDTGRCVSLLDLNSGNHYTGFGAGAVVAYKDRRGAVVAYYATGRYGIGATGPFGRAFHRKIELKHTLPSRLAGEVVKLEITIHREARSLDDTIAKMKKLIKAGKEAAKAAKDN